MMGRKELQAVAAGIVAEPPMIRARLCVRFGRIFKGENPRFDAQKWVEACEVKHPDIALARIVED